MQPTLLPIKHMVIYADTCNQIYFVPFSQLHRTFPPAVLRVILSLHAACGKWQAALFPSEKEVNRLYFTVTAGPFDLSLITLDGYL